MGYTCYETRVAYFECMKYALEITDLDVFRFPEIVALDVYGLQHTGAEKL